MLRPSLQSPRRPVRPGAAAVEMALISVLLLAPLMTGLFEMSRALMAKETLCNAARKGCRTGILKQYGNSDIYNDAVNIMRDNGYDSSKFNPAPPSGPVQGTTYIGSITITVTDPNGNTLTDSLDAPSGSKVTVQAAIPASSVMWTSRYYYMSSSTLESDLIVMMKQ